MLRDTVGMAVLFGFTMGRLAMASGWNCVAAETPTGFPHAKIVNSTTKPRVPAVFVVSGKVRGTLVHARYSEIDKTNLVHGVRYEASQGDYTAKLYVKYREGVNEPIENGETVTGKLTIIKEGDDDREGSVRAYEMDCARYLKNP